MAETENESIHSPHSIRTVPFAQSYIKEKYSDTIGLATSILGQVLLGTIKGSKRKKEVIKLCLKDMKNEFSDRVAEDPKAEIAFMKTICNRNHPNFVRFIDAIQDKKLYCICLEYVIGGDMCTHLQNIGTGIGHIRAKKYAIQLCKAVYFMHQNGYCHLDLSLENILWDKRNDIVKICDFGLCREFPNRDTSQYFEAATIRPGKKGYMAPEIYAYQKFNGEKADVFSLGVVIFILLTGFPPFTTPNASDKCFQFMYYGKLEWLLEKWKLNDIISKECRDLLAKIFCHSKKRCTVKDMLESAYLGQSIADIDQEIAELYSLNVTSTAKKSTYTASDGSSDASEEGLNVQKRAQKASQNKKQRRKSKTIIVKKVSKKRRNSHTYTHTTQNRVKSKSISIHESSTEVLSDLTDLAMVDTRDRRTHIKQRSKSLCYSYENKNIRSMIDINSHINNQRISMDKSNTNNTQNVTQTRAKHESQRHSSGSQSTERDSSPNSERSHSHTPNSDDNKEQTIANLRRLNETQLITQKHCNAKNKKNGNFTPNNEYDNDRKEGDYETGYQRSHSQERRFSINSNEAGNVCKVVTDPHSPAKDNKLDNNGANNNNNAPNDEAKDNNNVNTYTKGNAGQI